LYTDNDTSVENYDDVEIITIAPRPISFDFEKFLETSEFYLLLIIAGVVLASVVVMCAACIATSKKKNRRPSGYNRAATQV